MISAQTYLPFVAPFVMGACGLLIYCITIRMTRSKPDTPR